MRWKDKTPHWDDERIITVFLLFPKCINGEWRWLEFAKIYQIYMAYWTGDCWEDIRWIDDK